MFLFISYWLTNEVAVYSDFISMPRFIQSIILLGGMVCQTAYVIQ